MSTSPPSATKTTPCAYAPSGGSLSSSLSKPSESSTSTRWRRSYADQASVPGIGASRGPRAAAAAASAATAAAAASSLASCVAVLCSSRAAFIVSMSKSRALAGLLTSPRACSRDSHAPSVEDGKRRSFTRRSLNA